MTDPTPNPNPVDMELIQLLAEAAWARKARNIVAFDVRKTVFYTDAMIVCTGTSDRHDRAVAEALEGAAAKAGLSAPTTEGRTHGRWILLDFGSVTVHVFHEFLREMYDLERLFGDAPRIPLTLKADPTDNEGWDEE